MDRKWVFVLVGCGSLLGLHFLMKSFKEKKLTPKEHAPTDGKSVQDVHRKRVHFSPVEEYIDDDVRNCGGSLWVESVFRLLRKEL